MSINISLPEELESKIYEKVRTGCYPSPNEVVIEALTDFFSKPTEDQILSYFVKKRLQEIEDSGEEFVEADLSELNKIREKIDRKHNIVKNE